MKAWILVVIEGDLCQMHPARTSSMKLNGDDRRVGLKVHTEVHQDPTRHPVDCLVGNGSVTLHVPVKTENAD